MPSPQAPAATPRPLRVPTWLAAVAGLALFALALWVLHRELALVHIADVRRALSQVGPAALLLAVAGTLGSYLALTGYDVLALRHVKRLLPYGRVATVSFIATAVGHNLGMAMLSAGAVRLRMYTRLGLPAAEVAVMTGVIALTFGLGVAFAAGLALVLEPGSAENWLRIPQGAARAIGGAVLAAVAAYGVFAWQRQRPLRLGSWQVQVPDAGMAWRQIGLAVIDLACAALALWALLPSDSAPTFAVFLGVYVLAIVAGIVSHVPGGLGVFETILLLALPQVPRDALLAAVVGYRLVYYLLPLVLAGVLAVSLTVWDRKAQLAPAVAAARPLFTWLAPAAAALAVFVTGAVLLFSGSLPAESGRLHLLHRIVPLPLLEVSHLAGSLIGFALLILAQALYRRVKLAYDLAFWMLAAAAAASLLKGLDAEEALIALGVLGLLWSARRAFSRAAAITSNILSPTWAAAIAAVLMASFWLGEFAFKHVEYANELWWRFAFRADAPRFLRASLLVATAAAGWALWLALRPAPPEPGEPRTADLERAARIVRDAPAADAALALVGDKRLLFDAGDEAFLMYQVRGRSWIAMGDPVGAPAAAEALAWQFREMADRHAGRVVFYQADAAHLPLYLDLGLSAIKLGEEATVALAGFTLEGPQRRELRQAHRHAQREGLSFEMIDAAAVPAMMDTLRAVSDAWLAAKHSREKGFSLGRFDPAYLARFPLALVRHDDRSVAFANVWTSGGRHELSIDLMRHRPDSPSAVMDFLFIELMLWGAREGYARFSLGMAPLAGLETHPLAPLWHRLGTVLYRYGEHFYNFQGLRAYKQKFDPQWQPRYLAAPGGIALPGVLLDVAALIGGGLTGIVAR